MLSVKGAIGALSAITNQSILREISPGYSLEGLMLKLKLQYFGHLMQRVDSLEKTLMLGSQNQYFGLFRLPKQCQVWDPLDCSVDFLWLL